MRTLPIWILNVNASWEHFYFLRTKNYNSLETQDLLFFFFLFLLNHNSLKCFGVVWVILLMFCTIVWLMRPKILFGRLNLILLSSNPIWSSNIPLEKKFPKSRGTTTPLVASSLILNYDEKKVLTFRNKKIKHEKKYWPLENK